VRCRRCRNSHGRSICCWDVMQRSIEFRVTRAPLLAVAKLQ
jgi:hypothetical protein